jgi:hypothetical protein
VWRGTSSSISPGESCPSDCANGRTGSDQWDSVLGLSNLPPASIAADWFMKFSERKQALIGEKVMGRKSDAE